VRRLLSLALLLVFSFPLISPVLALSDGSDLNLPACCRRNGAHHCAGRTQPAASPTSVVRLSSIPQRCPGYPAVLTQIRHGDLSFKTASLVFAEIVSHPASKLQTQTRVRVALDRSRQQRGPPTGLL
jgi:hypothetical protein